ncbi:PilZ domain-containing protein [Candidatus Sumerlaeota bacterium]|nr:PilZ domain-containing protein [Candidatus Sumerlaeota bacterium]
MTLENKLTLGDGRFEDDGRPRGGIERRRHPRYEYAADVLVRIVFMEETLSPSLMVAHTRDVGRGGMLVHIENLPEQHYRRLIRRQRPVRINAQIPGTDGETIFFGKVAWYDYQETSTGTSCLMGIEFEQLMGKAQETLNALLDRLRP